MHRSRKKERCYSLLPVKPVLPRKQGSQCVAVGPEDRYNKWISTHFLLSRSLYIWADVIWHGLALWSASISWPSYVPSQKPAYPPQSTLEARKCWKSTALLLDSAVAKPSMCYPHPATAQQNTAPERCSKENWLQLSQTQYNCIQPPTPAIYPTS